MVDNSGVGTGLKLWLIFFLGFFLLRYPVSLSILWAIVGALAGGVIASQLNIIKPVPPKTKQADRAGEMTQERGRFNLRERFEERALGGASLLGRLGRRAPRSFKSQKPKSRR